MYVSKGRGAGTMLIEEGIRCRLGVRVAIAKEWEVFNCTNSRKRCRIINSFNKTCGAITMKLAIFYRKANDKISDIIELMPIELLLWYYQCNADVVNGRTKVCTMCCWIEFVLSTSSARTHGRRTSETSSVCLLWRETPHHSQANNVHCISLLSVLFLPFFLCFLGSTCGRTGVNEFTPRWTSRNNNNKSGKECLLSSLTVKIIISILHTSIHTTAPGASQHPSILLP